MSDEGHEICHDILTTYENVVVGKEMCPCCEKARKLLSSKGVIYKYLDRSECIRLVEEVSRFRKHNTFPKIFLNRKFIGGYADLKKHYSKHG